MQVEPEVLSGLGRQMAAKHKYKPLNPEPGQNTKQQLNPKPRAKPRPQTESHWQP